MSEKKTKPKYSLFSNVAYMVRLALNGLSPPPEKRRWTAIQGKVDR